MVQVVKVSGNRRHEANRPDATDEGPAAHGLKTMHSLHGHVPPHRVGRVLSFFSIVRIGTLPTPHPQASVPPPPRFLGGGEHSLAREGLGESQFRRGDIHCGTLYIYVLCVPPPSAFRDERPPDCQRFQRLHADGGIRRPVVPVASCTIAAGN